MFGGGFGGGFRNPQMRAFRIGLLLVLLVSTFAFRGSGTSSDIRAVYLVLVLGMLAYGVSRRRRAGGPRRGPGQSQGRWPVGGAGGTTWGGAPSPTPVDVRPAPATSIPTATAAGWFPDPNAAGVERYWDGATWTKSRHREGDNWVES